MSNQQISPYEEMSVTSTQALDSHDEAHARGLTFERNQCSKSWNTIRVRLFCHVDLDFVHWCGLAGSKEKPANEGKSHHASHNSLGDEEERREMNPIWMSVLRTPLPAGNFGLFSFRPSPSGRLRERKWETNCLADRTIPSHSIRQLRVDYPSGIKM